MTDEKKIHYAPNYKIENGCLHEVKETPKRVYERKLCNFTPWIVSEITVDDGVESSTRIRLAAVHESGRTLHAHFSTGQSILLSGSGRDKKYGYRNGIQTDLGDIRNDVWRDLVRELIVRSHEEDLFDKLLEWEKEHTYWLKTKAELEHYTLELYAARIFDNPKWVDYEAFAKHYGYQPQSYEGKTTQCIGYT